MDILSRDTLALVDRDDFRKAVEDLLTEPAGTTRTVDVRPSDRRGSEEEPSQQKKVTLRRLAV